MSKATLASADQLFAPAKRRHKAITLPVSGHAVRIQSLTACESARYSAQTLAKNGSFKMSKLEDAERRLIVLCFVDDDGNRILNDRDMIRLGDWDSADATHAYKECAAHTGINTDDIEGLAKNSEKTTVED